MQASWGQLPVNDPARTAVGRAVVGTLALTASFLALTWVTKELPSIYLREPWQDDPYDVLVSFDLFVLPLLLVAGGARVVLCRRDQPLPIRRVVDLLRVSLVMLVIVVVTLASEWASIAVGAERARWTSVTAALTVALGVLTTAVVVVGVLVHRANRAVASADAALGGTPQRPDWLADAVAFGDLGATRLGAYGPWVARPVHWLDRVVVARVRAHPVRSAVIASVLLSLVGDTPQVVIEGYEPGLAAFFYGVSTASYVAFFVIAGSYLHVTERKAPHASAFLVAAVAACVGAVVGVAFRGWLWWIVGTSEAAATLAALVALTLITGLLTGAAAYVLARLRERLRITAE